MARAEHHESIVALLHTALQEPLRAGLLAHARRCVDRQRVEDLQASSLPSAGGFPLPPLPVPPPHGGGAAAAAADRDDAKTKAEAMEDAGGGQETQHAASTPPSSSAAVPRARQDERVVAGVLAHVTEGALADDLFLEVLGLLTPPWSKSDSRGTAQRLQSP